jgi:glutathione S-transferase
VTTSAEALLADLQGAPDCAKVRACLQLKGVPFRRTPATIGFIRGVRRAAPRAEPPVLQVGDETLVGARAIVDWLEVRAPAPPLLPIEPGARGYCRLLEQWADGVLGPLVGAVVWSDPGAADATARALAAEMVPGPLVRPAARWLRGRAGRRPACPPHELAPRVASALDVVEGSLAGRPYLLGAALTIADVAVYVQLARLDALTGRVAVARLGDATAAWRGRLDAVDALRTAVGP